MFWFSGTVLDTPGSILSTPVIGKASENGAGCVVLDQEWWAASSSSEPKIDFTGHPVGDPVRYPWEGCWPLVFPLHNHAQIPLCLLGKELVMQGASPRAMSCTWVYRVHSWHLSLQLQMCQNFFEKWGSFLSYWSRCHLQCLFLSPYQPAPSWTVSWAQKS